MTNPSISSRQFRKDDCICWGKCLKNTQKSMKQQKSRLFENESQLLFKPRQFLKNRTSEDLSVKQKSIQKAIEEKVG